MKNSKDEIQLEKDLLIETLKEQVKHYKKKLAKIKKQLSLCSVVGQSEQCNHVWGKRQESFRRISSLGTRKCLKCGIRK